MSLNFNQLLVEANLHGQAQGLPIIGLGLVVFEHAGTMAFDEVEDLYQLYADANNATSRTYGVMPKIAMDNKHNVTVQVSKLRAFWHLGRMSAIPKVARRDLIDRTIHAIYQHTNEKAVYRMMLAVIAEQRRQRSILDDAQVKAVVIKHDRKK